MTRAASVACGAVINGSPSHSSTSAFSKNANVLPDYAACILTSAARSETSCLGPLPSAIG
jgi:hypothetical protein